MKAVVIIVLSFLLFGCARSLPFSEQVQTLTATGGAKFSTKEQAMAAIVGHYAHYDVVAYEEPNKKRPMRTFIVSYGFTDFTTVDGELIQSDRFCHAKQKINYRSVVSSFNDQATQAILPRSQKVELTQNEGYWQLYRPATPTLLGITGNPELPLSRDVNDPMIIDADQDGHPGVTVDILIGGFIKGEIYLTRREIFENFVRLQSDGNLVGHVKDRSEQFVLGASMKALLTSSEPVQIADPALNPLILVKIPQTIQSCDELMQRRDEWFPPEPAFY